MLTTAFTAFRAVKQESKRARADARVAVHTGFCGCGAFGGHRVLMAILQIVAAEIAGIDRMVFHAGQGGGGAVEAARRAVDDLRGVTTTSGELIDGLGAVGLESKVRDGN